MFFYSLSTARPYSTVLGLFRAFDPSPYRNLDPTLSRPHDLTMLAYASACLALCDAGDGLCRQVLLLGWVELFVELLAYFGISTHCLQGSQSEL